MIFYGQLLMNALLKSHICPVGYNVTFFSLYNPTDDILETLSKKK